MPGAANTRHRKKGISVVCQQDSKQREVGGENRKQEKEIKVEKKDAIISDTSIYFSFLN